MFFKIKYELYLWFMYILKIVPGQTGSLLRCSILPINKGKNVFFWENTQIDSPKKLFIGNNVSINRGCILHAGGEISIGDDVLIGPEVIIYSQNHRYKDSSLSIRMQGYEKSKVIIGNNIWIGARTIILPGVTVGNNVVIAAGSIVTKDIDCNSVFAGVPAKKIKNLD